MAPKDFIRKAHHGDYAVLFKNKNGITKDQVLGIFSNYGKISRVKQTGSAYGLCFVHFLYKKDAIKAVVGLKDHQDVTLILAESYFQNSKAPNFQLESLEPMMLPPPQDFLMFQPPNGYDSNFQNNYLSPNQAHNLQYSNPGMINYLSPTGGASGLEFVNFLANSLALGAAGGIGNYLNIALQPQFNLQNHGPVSNFQLQPLITTTMMPPEDFLIFNLPNNYAVSFPNRICLDRDLVHYVFSIYGKVLSVIQTGDVAGICFVNFETKEDAIRAIVGVQNYHSYIQLRPAKLFYENQGTGLNNHSLNEPINSLPASGTDSLVLENENDNFSSSGVEANMQIRNVEELSEKENDNCLLDLKLPTKSEVSTLPSNSLSSQFPNLQQNFTDQQNEVPTEAVKTEEFDNKDEVPIDLSLQNKEIKIEPQLHKTYQCLQCDFSTNIKGRYESHIEAHESDCSFQCPLCSFITTKKTTFRAHFVNRHGKIERPFKCQDCTYSAYFSKTLETHVKNHQLNRPDLYDNNPHTGKVKSNSVNHIQEHKHPQYPCSGCAFSTLSAIELTNHFTKNHQN